MALWILSGKAPVQFMALRILSWKASAQFIPFRKLSGKIHFLVSFYTSNWNGTYHFSIVHEYANQKTELENAERKKVYSASKIEVRVNIKEIRAKHLLSSSEHFWIILSFSHFRKSMKRKKYGMTKTKTRV